MMIDATISLGKLQAEFERLGATVIWPNDETKELAGRSVTVEADVDEDEAFNALPRSYFGSDVAADRDFAEPRDVTDFVSACAGGDRSMAEALLARVFATNPNLDAASRALRAAPH